MDIGNIIDKFTNKFTETIFYKKDSELEYQIDALKNVQKVYPYNYAISKKLTIAELGLKGEKEIEFELKNANIGMYVLHDVNIEYNDLKAQIDYIVITPGKTYFIECKNLIGDITIDNKGNFIREYQYGKRKVKEGIYSPLTQAQRHIEIFKKIWKERNNSIVDKTIRIKTFDEWYVPLVVLANSKNVLNDRYAPKDIKKYIVKSDRLVDYIKKDIDKIDKDLLLTQKEMNTKAFCIMDGYNKSIERDYEQELIEYCKKNERNSYSKKVEKSINKPIKIVNVDVNSILSIRNKLVEFRKEKSKKMGIPAYYIFTNEELDQLLKLMPIDIEELEKSKILSSIKIKSHGKDIIDVINS